MLRAGLVRRAMFWDAVAANWAAAEREHGFERVTGARPEARAFDWSEACDRCRNEQQLSALIAQREQRVRAILDSIGAPGVGYLIGGSKATYPISDCDVTVINERAGAGAHRVVAEFYRRFREQYGVEPETMFDANVFANFPELTAHWVPWDDPRLRAIFEDPRFVKKRNASQLAGAFA